MALLSLGSSDSEDVSVIVPSRRSSRVSRRPAKLDIDDDGASTVEVKTHKPIPDEAKVIPTSLVGLPPALAAIVSHLDLNDDDDWLQQSMVLKDRRKSVAHGLKRANGQGGEATSYALRYLATVNAAVKAAGPSASVFYLKEPTGLAHFALACGAHFQGFSRVTAGAHRMMYFYVMPSSEVPSDLTFLSDGKCRCRDLAEEDAFKVAGPHAFTELFFRSNVLAMWELNGDSEVITPYAFQLLGKGYAPYVQTAANVDDVADDEASDGEDVPPVVAKGKRKAASVLPGSVLKRGSQFDGWLVSQRDVLAAQTVEAEAALARAQAELARLRAKMVLLLDASVECSKEGQFDTASFDN
jgi:hypothetical protein